MLEKDMKDDLFWYLDSHYEKLRVMEELVIGKSRADMAVVLPDLLAGCELKSNGDSYSRLPIQIKYYDMYFDKNYLVVGETHKKHASEHIPEHWGLICIPNVGNDITVLREAKPDPKCKLKVKLRRQLTLLWRSEIANIRTKHGLYRYSGRDKAFMIRDLLKNIGPDEYDTLRAEICGELFEREYTI